VNKTKKNEKKKTKVLERKGEEKKWAIVFFATMITSQKTTIRS
jgi:hypothetical protein